ncbi:MAG: lipid IV(A) 3-deoxy-D-manno-octulosonic acid transferase [Pseudomonadales bacterium]|nr:lipid IV(A) 3-deoxy-D-manno-octulosonic acid transferase [Pseudomonadales bacterium]
MNRCLYTLLYYLLLPFIFLRLLLRARKAPNYAKRWAERLGYFPPPAAVDGLWLHSVSVGETIAAAPLIKQIQKTYPQLPIVITTMTPTGSDRVRALFGHSVFHVYVPYDTPGAVKRFLKKVRPRLVLIMETELWPNLIHYCHRQGVRQIVMNARLSERSARGYRRFPVLMQDMLAKLDLVAAQTEGDAERLYSLGLDKDKLKVTGSLKFDINIPETILQQAQALRSDWGRSRSIWIAASTHAGEDEQVLRAFQWLLKIRPDLLLVLVPRHPERFNQVATLCQSQGLQLVRRSANEAVEPDTQVMLGDSMGELLLFYAASDVAFVGGTLVATGGHNFLEPVALGIPVICGPHRFNFSQVSEMLLAAGAMQEVTDTVELGEAVAAILEEPKISQRMLSAGLAVIEANRGAQQRLFELIRVYLD